MTSPPAEHLLLTVSSPAPGGGESVAVDFTVDDFAVSGPAAPLTVTAGKSAAITITVAPSNVNGFANAVTFSVSGLPPATNATFDPLLRYSGRQPC